MSPSEAFDLASKLETANMVALILAADEARFLAAEYADRQADTGNASAMHQLFAIGIRFTNLVTAIRADHARRTGTPAAAPESPPAAEPPAVKPAAAPAKSKRVDLSFLDEPTLTDKPAPAKAKSKKGGE